MSPEPRVIYVDDTSPLISYKGSWAGGTTYSSNNTVLGGPFNNTLHALSGLGSFTFNFIGSSIIVMASFQNSTLPSWTCFINGAAVPSNKIHLNLNNVEICSSSVNNIAGKMTPTNLTVVASGTSDGPFLFDYIKYVPDATVLLDNATVVVDAYDDQIHYSEGWTPYESIGLEASGKEASLTFDFIGIQITWMTSVSYSNEVTSSAHYSIDDGSLVQFQVPNGTSVTSAPHYNLVSFQSPILSPGSHRLFVQYGANNPDDAARLRLDNLVILNLTSPSSTPSSTTSTSTTTPGSTPSPTTTSTTTPRSTTTSTPSPKIIPVRGRKLSAGALAGVVIGSLVGGILIMFGLMRVIRFIKRKLASVDSIRVQAIPYIKTYGDDHDRQLQVGLNSNDRELEGNWILA